MGPESSHGVCIAFCVCSVLKLIKIANRDGALYSCGKCTEMSDQTPPVDILEEIQIFAAILHFTVQTKSPNAPVLQS